MSWIWIFIWYYTISKHCKFLFKSLLLIWRFLCWSPQLLYQLRWHMPHKKLQLLVCQLWGVKTQLPERSPLHDWKPSVRGTAIDGLCCQSLVNCSCSLSPPFPAPVARASPRLSSPSLPLPFGDSTSRHLGAGDPQGGVWGRRMWGQPFQSALSAFITRSRRLIESCTRPSFEKRSGRKPKPKLNRLLGSCEVM